MLLFSTLDQRKKSVDYAAMSRRGGPGLQVLIGVVVVGLFLYGFYSYHEVQSRLRTMEEKADRLKVEHESVSAQLQGRHRNSTDRLMKCPISGHL